MSKEFTKTPIVFALSAVFGASLVATPLTNAEENPFGMSPASNGYLVAEAETDKGKEGACGEGKCGGDMKKEGEEKQDAGEEKKEEKKGEKKSKCGKKKDAKEDAGKADKSKEDDGDEDGDTTETKPAEGDKAKPAEGDKTKETDKKKPE